MHVGPSPVWVAFNIKVKYISFDTWPHFFKPSGSAIAVELENSTSEVWTYVQSALSSADSSQCKVCYLQQSVQSALIWSVEWNKILYCVQLLREDFASENLLFDSNQPFVQNSSSYIAQASDLVDDNDFNRILSKRSPVTQFGLIL